MQPKLTDLPTGKLLEKFGAGNHKPGSGSASALQGMLSAQMLRTVIDLTNEPKRSDTYSKNLDELLKIKSEIETRIYPGLETLFQEDSDQFDKVIKLREARDVEKDLFKRRLLAEQALEALKPAIEIPLKIAGFCIELGQFSAFVFDHGFKSARGDSSVALNSAISAISCCLSIAELNLSSLPPNEWTEMISQLKKNIKVQYKELEAKGTERLRVLEIQTNESRLFHQEFAEFRKGDLANSIVSNSDIEMITRRLQNLLWKLRDKIWKQDIPEEPIDVLQPHIVLKKILNYVFIQPESLGIYELEGTLVEVAGMIDKSKKIVEISKHFQPETQNFTAAHELGHALLHRQAVLHRDKAIDGSAGIHRNKQELEADKFATFFLMPAKLVQSAFLKIFETPKFTINESTVLALGERSIQAFKERTENIRGLASALASAEYYAGKSFVSLSQLFGVSIQTMAIRLEELNLLEF